MALFIYSLYYRIYYRIYGVYQIGEVYARS